MNILFALLLSSTIQAHPSSDFCAMEYEAYGELRTCINDTWKDSVEVWGSQANTKGRSSYLYSLCLRTGKGLPRNISLADKYLHLSASQGNAWAITDHIMNEINIYFEHPAKRTLNDVRTIDASIREGNSIISNTAAEKILFFWIMDGTSDPPRAARITAARKIIESRISHGHCSLLRKYYRCLTGKDRIIWESLALDVVGDEKRKEYAAEIANQMQNNSNRQRDSLMKSIESLRVTLQCEIDDRGLNEDIASFSINQHNSVYYSYDEDTPPVEKDVSKTTEDAEKHWKTQAVQGNLKALYLLAKYGSDTSEPTRLNYLRAAYGKGNESLDALFIIRLLESGTPENRNEAERLSSTLGQNTYLSVVANLEIKRPKLVTEDDSAQWCLKTTEMFSHYLRADKLSIERFSIIRPFYMCTNSCRYNGKILDHEYWATPRCVQYDVGTATINKNSTPIQYDPFLSQFPYDQDIPR